MQNINTRNKKKWNINDKTDWRLFITLLGKKHQTGMT